MAVLDLVANGASPSLASAAGGMVASELDRLGVFKVISSDDIRAMLALERQKMILGGCSDAGCLTEIGGALGADYLVSGQVSAIGGGGSRATTPSATPATGGSPSRSRRPRAPPRWR